MMHTALVSAIDKSQNQQVDVPNVNVYCQDKEHLELIMNKIDPNCEICDMEFGHFEIRGVLAEPYSIRVRLNGLGSPGMGQ